MNRLTLESWKALQILIAVVIIHTTINMKEIQEITWLSRLGFVNESTTVIIALLWIPLIRTLIVVIIISLVVLFVDMVIAIVVIVTTTRT